MGSEYWSDDFFNTITFTFPVDIVVEKMDLVQGYFDLVFELEDQEGSGEEPFGEEIIDLDILETNVKSYEKENDKQRRHIFVNF